MGPAEGLREAPSCRCAGEVHVPWRRRSTGALAEPVLLPRPRRVELSDHRVAVGEPLIAADASLRAQGYRIRIASGSVQVDAFDEAGARYARATLAQLGAEAPTGL